MPGFATVFKCRSALRALRNLKFLVLTSLSRANLVTTNLSYVIWTCDVRDTDQTQEEKMETLHLGVTGLLFSLPDVILHQVLALRKDGHHET